MSIDQLMVRSFKARSTVMAALSEAQEHGILRRRTPESGARYATAINYFDKRLTDAAEKSRPYLGHAIFFDTKIKVRKGAKSTNSTGLLTKKIQSNHHGSALLGVQKLDLQNLDPEFSIKHPAPVHELVPLAPGRDASLPLPPDPDSVPAPLQGAGGGSAINIQRKANRGICFCKDVLTEIEKFWTFLSATGAGLVTTHFQRRKQDGSRGGKYLIREQPNLQGIVDTVALAGLQGVEVACIIQNVILLDDLDQVGMDRLIQVGLAMMVIETSQSNFQALLVTEPGWIENEIKDTQRALSARYGGDSGAVAARQPHRLPGSLNLKNNESWITKLALIQHGDLVLPENPQRQQPAHSQRRPVEPVEGNATRLDSGAGRDGSPSGQDFGRACQLLASGSARSDAILEIAARAQKRGKAGRSETYAALTVTAAAKRLQMTV